MVVRSFHLSWTVIARMPAFGSITDHAPIRGSGVLLAFKTRKASHQWIGSGFALRSVMLTSAGLVSYLGRMIVPHGAATALRGRPPDAICERAHRGGGRSSDSVQIGHERRLRWTGDDSRCRVPCG